MSEINTPDELADRIEKTVKLHRGLGTDCHFTLTVDAASALAEYLRLSVRLVAALRDGKVEMDAAAEEIQRLTDYIWSLDGKTIAIRTDGDTFIDDGFIRASDVVNKLPR